jgi:hypothetical protein
MTNDLHDNDALHDERCTMGNLLDELSTTISTMNDAR